MPLNVLSTSMTYPSATWPARGIFVQSRLEALGKLAQVRVIAPRPWFPWLAPASRVGLEREALPTRRPKMFYFPRILKPADPWFYARVLYREIRTLEPAFRPDLIDAHYVWPDGVGAAWAAQRAGLPFTVTIRGKIVSQSRYRARRNQIRDMLRSADARIAVSEDMAERAAALAGDGRRVHVIPNGVDSGWFRPIARHAAREQLGLAADARYLVSVAFVQELKGPHRLVGIVPELRRRAGDVRLLLVGDATGEAGYSERLNRLIASLGLTDVVTRVEGATREQIALYMNAADVFVLGSRSEGWCNAIHEALACGTPVVATDVGGNRELVRTPDDGRLVPFGDDAAMRDAVIEALARLWRRDEIARRTGSRSWDDVARDVFDVFRGVLERRACRRGS